MTYLSHGEPSPISDSSRQEGLCGARMSASSASSRWLRGDDISKAVGTDDGGGGDGSSGERPGSGVVVVVAEVE